jgi:hypothetical protein
MIDLIIFLTLLALGYGAGTWAEKRHYRSIAQREEATINLPAVSLKSVAVPEYFLRAFRLVVGSAVIWVD